jgi:hypothetical protein
MSASTGGVPFTQQADALRARLRTLLPSDRYTDTLGEVNNWGFAVAGAKKDSLLQSIGQALLEDIEQGRDVKHFQRQFAAIVAKQGWSYRGPIGWRARVIFETNLGQSREAGKWRQIGQAVADGREFWVRYVHTTRTQDFRPEHKAWDGTILPPTDPWWRTHAPKNGYGCNCTVLMVSPGMLRREGWKVSDSAPEVVWESRQINTATGVQTVRVPEGIGTGFGHNPGQALFDRLVPRPADEFPLVTLDEMTGGDPTRQPRIFGAASTPAPPRPEPRIVDASRILPPDLPREEYVRRFLAEFGATTQQPAVFIDVIGSPLVIGERMFRDAVTGVSKVTKQGRAPTILLSADAIRAPDEIWAHLQVLTDWNGKSTIRLVRHYIAWLQAPDRQRSGFVVFTHGPDGWSAVTAYDMRGDRPSEEAMLRALDAKRQGILLYRRPES